jgi:hypothetical protein
MLLGEGTVGGEGAAGRYPPGADVVAEDRRELLVQRLGGVWVKLRHWYIMGGRG